MLLPEVKKHYGKLKLLIDGNWVDSKSSNLAIDRNPATDEAIAEFPVATSEEAIQAVEAALNKVSARILEGHLNSCVITAVQGEDSAERQRVLKEILEVFETSTKV